MKIISLTHRNLVILLIGIGGLSFVTLGGFIYWHDSAKAGPVKERDSFIYGRELLHQGKYKESEEEIKKVLRINPANVKALSTLGTLYYRQGNTDLAYKYWSDALRLAPNDPTLQGLVKALEKDKFRQGPLYHMELKTVDHAPAWERHLTLGQDLYLKGNFSEAVKELEKAIRIKPDESKIYFILGATHLKMDNRDRTIEAWEKALKLNPDDKMTSELLGKLTNRQE